MSCQTCNESKPNTSASVGQVLAAWRDALVTATVEQHITAADRQSICANCSFCHTAPPMSVTALAAALVPGMADHPLGNKFCKPCGCPVVAKTYVKTGHNGEGGCPLAKWPTYYQAQEPTESDAEDNGQSDGE